MSSRLVRNHRIASRLVSSLQRHGRIQAQCPHRHSSTQSRQWSTPLAKSLAEAITTTGPISIAQYMRQCLTSPDGGYYTTRAEEGVDQFGKTGDFVTSPEISQVFGELVGIWIVAEWMAQGKPSSNVEIIELGPGRGTLMDDVLRTIKRFPDMAEAVSNIRMIEASEFLRKSQHERLCDKPLSPTDDGNHSAPSKHISKDIIWTDSLTSIPRSPTTTPFIVAHEFFDALPIHAFTSIKTTPKSTITTSATAPPKPAQPRKEWRELVVSPTAPPSRLNPPKTPPPEFELTVSKGSTAHSALLPTLSPRYNALKDTENSVIEISPETRIYATEIAQLIGGASPYIQRLHKPGQPRPFVKEKASGAALIIDYGPADTIPVNTLRGIRSHKTVSPFEAPGRIDLTADVDFGAIVETALSASDGVAVHGPTTQGAWLGEMGAEERTKRLVAEAKSEEQKLRVRKGWERLVGQGPDGMGRVYKVLAIVPDAERRVVGFGGDVVGR